MPIYHTIVLLQNVTLDPEARFEFAGDIALTATPA